MCCTWLFMLRASSKKRLMFLATVEIGTTVLPSSMCGIESLFLICGAHITIISVFAALNLSLFITIQSCIFVLSFFSCTFDFSSPNTTQTMQDMLQLFQNDCVIGRIQRLLKDLIALVWQPCVHLIYRALKSLSSAVSMCGLDDKPMAFVHIGRCLTNVYRNRQQRPSLRIWTQSTGLTMDDSS